MLRRLRSERKDPDDPPEFRRERAGQRLEILEVIMAAIDHRDEVLRAIEDAGTVEDARSALLTLRGLGG